MTDQIKYPSANVTSLPVLLSNVKSSFNTAGVSASSATLYQLRRGGGIVPNLANAYGSISTTNPRLASFANMTFPPVNLRNPAVGIQLDDFSIAPVHAHAEIYIFTTTTANLYTGGAMSVNTQWLFEGTRDEYDARLTKVSGDSPTGGYTVNTWINLNTSYVNWTWTTAGVGFDVVNFGGYLELRMNSSPNIVFANNEIVIALAQEI
jgi:hypothetical protein